MKILYSLAIIYLFIKSFTVFDETKSIYLLFFALLALVLLEIESLKDQLNNLNISIPLPQELFEKLEKSKAKKKL